MVLQILCFIIYCLMIVGATVLVLYHEITGYAFQGVVALVIILHTLIFWVYL